MIANILIQQRPADPTTFKEKTEEAVPNKEGLYLALPHYGQVRKSWTNSHPFMFSEVGEARDLAYTPSR